jgi:hypothetical protein
MQCACRTIIPHAHALTKSQHCDLIFAHQIQFGRKDQTTTFFGKGKSVALALRGVDHLMWNVKVLFVVHASRGIFMRKIMRCCLVWELAFKSQMIAIPETVGRMPSLRKLECSSSQALTKIPASIGMCPRLTEHVALAPFFFFFFHFGVAIVMCTVVCRYESNQLRGTYPTNATHTCCRLHKSGECW